MVSDRLFKPLEFGNVELQHRLVMAPLTRFRADTEHNVSPDAAEYYAQRASVPGTLIITEAVFITPQAGGYKRIPGIWSDAQIEGWRKIVDGVHAKGSPIFMQLWYLGRVATAKVLEEEGGYSVVGASPISVDSSQTSSGAATTVPVELTTSEVEATVKDYANATRNALKAGFDGVEIHGKMGYVLPKFIS